MTRQETDTLKEMYNPDGSTLRRAQLRMTEMLAFIDTVCTEHNITYWIDSGTLLGAVRHEGFIPWDEDTDICMPYKDMMKFKKIMSLCYKDNVFVLQCHETDHNYWRPWYVLRDTRSEYIQDSEMHKDLKYRGLQVDIFPVDRHIIPSVHHWCVRKYNSFIHLPLLGFGGRYKRRKKFVALSYHIFHGIIAPFARLISLPAGKRPYYKMSYGCPFESKRSFSAIYPLKKIKFENIKLSAPNDAGAYLTGLYGDWRVIPKPDKIQTHDVEIIFY